MSTAMKPPTLLEWGKTWSAERVALGVYRSAGTERLRLLDALRRAPFGALPIDEITPEDIRRWAFAETQRPLRRGRRVDGQWVSFDLPGTRVRRTTVESTLGSIRVCMRDAVDSGVARRNPAARVIIPPEPIIHEPWTWLTLEEIRIVTGERMPLELRLLVTAAIYTGLRKGELWGLRCEDLQLESDRPHAMIRRSYDGPTKSGRPRMVPLLRPAVVALRELVGLTAARPNPLGLVAPLRNGAMRAPGLPKHWHRWRVHAGVTRRVRWHDLRHTCASHLVQGSWGRVWRLEQIAQFLGHADISTTQRYAHLSPDGLHAVARATDLFFVDSKKVG